MWVASRSKDLNILSVVVESPREGGDTATITHYTTHVYKCCLWHWIYWSKSWWNGQSNGHGNNRRSVHRSGSYLFHMLARISVWCYVNIAFSDQHQTCWNLHVPIANVFWAKSFWYCLHQSCLPQTGRLYKFAQSSVTNLESFMLIYCCFKCLYF